MNANYRRVPTEFGPEIEFAIEPVPAAPFRAVQDNSFERLKTKLLIERLEQAWEPDLTSRLRRAANDAAALAWVTPYPLLVFPVLFDEKADIALQMAERQARVYQRSRELLAV